MADPAPDPATIQAYQEADYVVHGVPGLTMHIGVPCQPLAALYARETVACCAFISACNPRGDASSEHLNDARQAAFALLLNRRGLRYLPGEGRDPRGRWTAEPSFLVLDIDLDAARALGQELDQNAIVCCGPDAVPALIVLR